MVKMLRYLIASNWMNPTLLGCRAPLTPIVGETCQREMPDGTKFYAEQIQHKPLSILSTLIEGKNGEFRIYGSYHFNVGLSGMNSLAGSRVGATTFEFADGVTYVMKDCPPMEIRNIVAGQQHQMFNGHCYIEDLTNKLCMDLHYAPWESASVMDSFKKAFKWNVSKKDVTNKRPKRADDITVSIYQRTENGLDKG